MDMGVVKWDIFILERDSVYMMLRMVLLGAVNESFLYG